MKIREHAGDWVMAAASLLVSTALHAAPNVPTGPGCPMAHCNSQLTGNTQTAAPAGTTAISGPDPYEGSGLGLGCSSNLSIVACTFYQHDTSVAGALRVYGADGGAKFSSTGSLQSLSKWASSSAPIVFNDNSVLAVDNQYIAYYYPTGSTTWASVSATLPDYTSATNSNVPTSPVMIASNIALIATSCHNSTQPGSGTPPPCEVSTWRIDTSGLTKLDSAYLYNGSYNSQNGLGYFDTQNTPTVDPAGPNGKPRVYILSSEVCYAHAWAGAAACSPGLLTPRQGQLIAIDVDATSGRLSSCTAYKTSPGTCIGDHTSQTGSINVILSGSTAYTNNPAYFFPGPSGSSPLLIKNGSPATAKLYFDGLQRSAGGLVDGSGNPLADCTLTSVSAGAYVSGCFYGVQDTGSGITRTWSSVYPNSQFQAAAAVDTDGYLWIYPVVAGSGYTCSNTTNYSPNGTTRYRQCLLRIDPATGGVVQSAYTDPGTHQLVEETIDLTRYLPNAGGTTQSVCTNNPCYAPSSAITISPVTSGGFTITVGGVPLLGTNSQPRYMTKIGVPAGWGTSSSVDPGTALSIPTSNLYGITGAGFLPGQFAIVQTQDPTPKKRTVFTTGGIALTDNLPGTGPYFIGDP